MTVLYYVFLFLFLFLAVVLSLVILAQESKSSGLGSSFGGAEAGDSLFGASTPDVLKKFTAMLSVVFMVGCVILSLWTASLGRSERRSIESESVAP